MSEWVKVLVGLISGIGIGVLAEPLKRWVGTAYMTKRAEKAIYWEMSAMYVIFCMDKKTIEDASQNDLIIILLNSASRYLELRHGTGLNEFTIRFGQPSRKWIAVKLVMLKVLT
jgi:hypothetical protein